MFPVCFLEHAKQIKQADVGGFGLDGNFTELVHDAFASTLTRSSLASLRSEGSASPAISSPDMIADLIWFLICS